MAKKVRSGEKLIHITSIEDLEKIRTIDKEMFNTVILVLDNDLDFSDIMFNPIDAKGVNIVIKGNKKHIRNLTIDKGKCMEIGLFSRAKSLHAIDLYMVDYIVIGQDCVGGLVGSVDEEVILKKCGFFDGHVIAQAYCGGVVGTSKELNIEETVVKTRVSGRDIIGGVVGTSNRVKENKNVIDTRIHAVIGKAKGPLVGYNSEKEFPRVNRMLSEALKHLEPKATPEEEEIIKLMIR